MNPHAAAVLDEPDEEAHNGGSEGIEAGRDAADEGRPDFELSEVG